MKIYCIETGKVKVKKNQINKADGPVPGMAKLLFGREWSDWLPIHAWVIDHPEGIFIVDTGETHKTNIKGYLPKWHPYYATSVKFDVKPENEIGTQLKKLGIDPEKDVTRVIMTHLHTDHAGGMYHFPGNRFLMDRTEFKNALGLSGILKGYLPHRWPKNLEPEFITFENRPYGPFEKQQKITRDGKIRILPTPGHVPTHISVVVEMDGIDYFLAGDTSYREDLMLLGIPDGVGIPESVNTLKKIRQLANEKPVVYLPSHDPESLKRLEKKQVITLYKEKILA
jgi:glyoxylase-like metal-dependent hydrolase (beta-lactamase superfamily II)